MTNRSLLLAGIPFVIAGCLGEYPTHPVDVDRQLTAAAAASGRSCIYVTDFFGNRVRLVDPVANQVADAVRVGSTPFGVVVAPDGARVYVVNLGAGTVSVIETVGNTVVSTVNVGGRPNDVAISPDGGIVYVGNFPLGVVQPIETATNTVLPAIGLPAAPSRLALTPDGALLYVTHGFSDNSVSVLQTATNAVVATVTVGRVPSNVAVTPDGQFAYVVVSNSKRLAVLDTGTHAVVAFVDLSPPTLSTPIGVAFTPDGALAYVTNFFAPAASVWVLQTATYSLETTIGVGSGAADVAFASDGSRAYVVNQTGRTLSIVETAGHTVVATIAAGSLPVQVAVGELPLWTVGADAGPDQTVLVGLPLTFVGSGKSTCRTVGFDWDFGDGTGAPGKVVAHVYTAPGVFTATLTVTDTEGETLSDQARVAVQTPEEALTDLTAFVESLGLAKGIETALLATLDAALRSLMSDAPAAIPQLEAFIKQVEALRGIALTDQEANDLLQRVREIIRSIEANT